MALVTTVLLWLIGIVGAIALLVAHARRDTTAARGQMPPD